MTHLLRRPHGYFAGLSCVLATIFASTSALAEPVSFYRQIRPIFQANCQGCHQPAKAGGEYVMTTFAQLLKGGETGDAAVVPGKPDESSLVASITPTNNEAEMPKGKPPLSAAEIELIKQWITAGAQDDTPESARRHFDREHPPIYYRPPVITSLDFSPDGTTLAVAGYSEVILHKADGSGVVDRLIGNSERIESVRFSPDGSLLAVAGGTPAVAGELQVWDVATRQLKLAHQVTYDVLYGANWSPDGKFVCFGCSDKSVRVLEIATGKQVLYTSTHEDRAVDTAFSVQGTHVISVSVDRVAKLTEIATQRFIDNITSITPGALKGGINSVARHPRTDVILVGGADGEPKFYEIFRKSERVIGDDANLIRKLSPLRGRVNAVALSRDGKRAAAVSSLDGSGEVRTYAVDADFQFPPEIIAIQSKRVSNRSAEERKKLDEFTNQGFGNLAETSIPETALYAVAFQSDGQAIAVAGADGKVRVLDAEKGSLLRAFVPVTVQPAEMMASTQNGPGVRKSLPLESESLTPNDIVEALEVLPATAKIDHPYDAIQTIVTARLASGDSLDVTRLVERKLSNDAVAVSPAGLVTANHDGRAELTMQLGGKSVSMAVEVGGLSDEFRPDFIRDVAPILAKMGCNQGTCHGANKGKGGFKLSLRGNDPLFDVRAYTDELSCRRVNFASPDNSLMLTKASAQVPHEGSRLTGPGEAYYEIMRAWVIHGAKLAANSPRVTGIEIQPQNPLVQRTGTKQQFRVLATYSNGQTRDVTPEAFLESGNIEVAKADSSGLTTALRRGEAAILARFEGAYAATTMTVMGDRSGFVWQDPPAHNFIDELVAAKLRRTKTLPSELCSDADFLRRVYLDLTGLPPTSADVRAFLADSRETRIKRDELIDRLLGSPMFVEQWTNKWADLLQVNRKYLGVEGAIAFRDWLKQQVTENRPYDQFVYELLTAKGSNREHPAAAYFKIHRQADETMETTTHLFLGLRFNCNKCHDHPFERWTQDQYYETAAYLAQFALQRDPESGDRKIEGTAVEGATPLYEIVVDKPSGDVTHERTGMVTPPKFPYGKLADEAAAGATRREQLAKWITSPENRYFARSYVNRLWAQLLGVGFIEPVDDLRASNPASNAELLDRLTQEFVSSRFDVRHMLRLICRSRTYQLSVATNAWNEDDRLNYSHAYARRLPAEVLYDTIQLVTGPSRDIPGAPKGQRAAQFLDATVNPAGGFLTQFGRPPRESPCECERSSGMQFGPVMSLVSGPFVGDVLSDPEGELAKLVGKLPDDAQLIDELFLRILNRPATPAEIATAKGALQAFPADHQKLIAVLQQAEGAFAPVLAEREKQRQALLEKAQTELAAYEKEIAPREAQLDREQQERVAKLESALREYEASLPQQLAAWEARAEKLPLWVPLDPSELSSTSATTLTKEADLSVVSTNSNGLGTYKFVAPTDLRGITAIRLEALTDKRSPKEGPGRAPNDGNFVLTEFELSAAARAAPSQANRVVFERATADFSQDGYSIATAIDGQFAAANNGWAIAPQAGKNHVAVFELATPLDQEGGAVLSFLLHQQFQSGEHSLGRFRLSVTTSPAPLLTEPVPGPVAEILKVAIDQRTEEQRKKVMDYYRGIDRQLLRLQAAWEGGRKPRAVDPRLQQLRDQLSAAQLPVLVDPQVQQLRDDVKLSEQQLANARLIWTQDLAWALINSPAFLFNH